VSSIFPKRGELTYYTMQVAAPRPFKEPPMYLKSLTLHNIKLIKELTLDFTHKDEPRKGEPRMWTVIIGPNGTCKTAILQAIALAAAGQSSWLALGGDLARLQRIEGMTPKDAANEDADPKPVDAPLQIEAQLHATHDAEGNAHTPHKNIDIKLKLDRTELVYQDDKNDRLEAKDLDDARRKQSEGWFISAHSQDRGLPENWADNAHRDSNARLINLFERGSSPGLHITRRFADDKERVSAFNKLIQVILRQPEAFFPGLNDMELRGRPNQQDPAGIKLKRIVQPLGTSGKAIKISPSQLGHGHQSTLAWIAELIGHYMKQSSAPLPKNNNADSTHLKSLASFEGIVLVDEIDETLHPEWQLSLIPSLHHLFPKLQFIVTTHSPLMLARLQPDEIVKLKLNEETGLVTRDLNVLDPRTKSAGELYDYYFGVSRTIPPLLADHLDYYRFYAKKADRTNEQDSRVKEARTALLSYGIGVPFEPFKRG
jgi:hypothetical protein